MFERFVMWCDYVGSRGFFMIYMFWEEMGVGGERREVLG